jgi:DNA-nicking Smr family endonuclease
MHGRGRAGAPPDRDRDPDDAPPDEAIELPIDGVLDLHAFHPSEVKALVTDYLDLCAEKGLLEIRVIHGKGTGALRRTVEAVLRRHPRVVRFGAAGEDGGGWGATLITLR